MEPNIQPAPRRSVGYRREYDYMAEVAAAELGATDAQLAKLFGVTRKSICKWKTDHPSFGEALRSGKVEADNRTQRSLFQRANGYTYTERKTLTTKDGREEVVIHERHVPPNVDACLKWLYNRRPNEWRASRSIGEDFGEPLTPVSINLIAKDCRRPADDEVEPDEFPES